MRKARQRTAGVDDGLRRVFVDSGAWIALVHERDQHHSEADLMFREAVARRCQLLTTNLIVAEVHRLLLFRVGIRFAAAVIDRMDRSERLTVEFATAGHHHAARAWLEKLGDQKISYADAVSFAVMQQTRCTTAMTFDDDFAVAGFERWLPPA